jgi:hypothetical protein
LSLHFFDTSLIPRYNPSLLQKPDIAQEIVPFAGIPAVRYNQGAFDDGDPESPGRFFV